MSVSNSPIIGTMGLGGGHSPWLPDHGNKTLSNVLTGLMLLAFLVDQCLEVVNLDFIKALQKRKSRPRLWEDFRFLVRWCCVENWAVMYTSILDPPSLQLKSA
ncbi:MAG: hypothetical protein K2X28_05525 [Alphaproteobacteria bacterium]|nr:hypothetical protein [Alphaproteobacteria bacterium]